MPSYYYYAKLGCLMQFNSDQVLSIICGSFGLFHLLLLSLAGQHAQGVHLALVSQLYIDIQVVSDHQALFSLQVIFSHQVLQNKRIRLAADLGFDTCGLL